MASGAVRSLLVLRASALVRSSGAQIQRDALNFSFYVYGRGDGCVCRRKNDVQWGPVKVIERGFARGRAGSRGRGAMSVSCRSRFLEAAAVEEELREEEGGYQEIEDVPEKKSRGESKKQSKNARNWGLELASLAPAQLRQAVKWASLDEDVYDAIMLVKNLGSSSRVRNGRRRQYNYIGGLLRDVDPELMESVLKAVKDGDAEGLVFDLSDHPEDEDVEDDNGREEEDDPVREVAEQWLEGLVGGLSAVEEEVYSIYDVDFDRQELRKLVRAARKSIADEFTAASETVELEGDGPAESGPKRASSKRSRMNLLNFLNTIAKQKNDNVQ